MGGDGGEILLEVWFAEQVEVSDGPRLKFVAAPRKATNQGHAQVRHQASFADIRRAYGWTNSIRLPISRLGKQRWSNW